MGFHEKPSKAVQTQAGKMTWVLCPSSCLEQEEVCYKNHPKLPVWLGVFFNDQWVCPFLPNPLLPYNSMWELCREPSHGWVGKGSNGEGSNGMGWFPNCASPSPRIPQRQRSCQDGEHSEDLGSPTAHCSARAALPSSALSARW